MQEADHILIPLLDGEFALGQIARLENGRALLFLTRTKTAPFTGAKPFIDAQIIAGLCIDVASVPEGHWPVVGYAAVPRIEPFYNTPLADMDLTDPAIVEAFANAVQGLYPWDGFPDTQIFSNMLRVRDVLPTHARMAADFPKPDPSA